MRVRALVAEGRARVDRMRGLRRHRVLRDRRHLHREPGDARAVAVPGVHAALEARCHDLGLLVAVEVADRDGADDLAPGRGRVHRLVVRSRQGVGADGPARAPACRRAAGRAPGRRRSPRSRRARRGPRGRTGSASPRRTRRGSTGCRRGRPSSSGGRRRPAGPGRRAAPSAAAPCSGPGRWRSGPSRSRSG